MSTKARELRWKLHCYKVKRLLTWGIDNHCVMRYNESLIEKLRNIYYGGIPASIILLTNKLSNGHCFDRALLLAQAFLDEEDDVRLVYAIIDGIRLNPEYGDRSDPLYGMHCFVERITKDGQHIIYDTSTGRIYTKELYWKMQNPKVLRINDKKSIIEFLKIEESGCPEDVDRDKYISPLILHAIESTYGGPFEFYSRPGVELLQREIEYYKKKINYDAVCKEIAADMQRLGML